MSISYLRGVTEWALMVALVFGAGAIARAQDEEPSDGNVVKIGRSDGEQAKPNLSRPGDQEQGRQEAPKYWIGLLGGAIPPDHVLRAQIDLPEKQGLLVANVVPESPAAKAGLKQHDILLKANNNDLHEMKDLIDLVMTEGAKKGQITLEILRHNKRETVYLKPEERPANAPVPQVGGGFGGGGVDPEFGIPKDLMEQFGGRIPMEFRNFGPGVIVGGGGGFANIPNGTSISVQKEGDKPVHVTVKRDGKTWEVTADDPEALKKLPEDLRPSVERMLHGGGAIFHAPQPFRLQGPDAGTDIDAGRMRERLERMEKRLEEMQRRLPAPNNSPAEKPKAENGQAK